MAHAKATVQAVRSAYVHQGCSLKQSATDHKVGYDTVRKWKQKACKHGDDWDKARAASLIAGEGADVVARRLLESHLRLHESALQKLDDATDIDPLLAAEAISRLSDAFNKTMSAVAKVAPELSDFAVRAATLQELTEYTAQHYAEQAESLLVVLEPFAEWLAVKYA